VTPVKRSVAELVPLRRTTSRPKLRKIGNPKRRVTMDLAS
jgi:hypothetical protein